MVIFRIENEQKLGPYYATYDSKWQTKDHDKHPSTPGPNRDILKNCKNNTPLSTTFNEDIHKFGFKSLWQLKRWFNKQERLNLFHAGFTITKITISPKYVILAKKQLIFKDINTTREYIPLFAKI